MSAKLIARKGNMEFFFTLLSKNEDEIVIEMYNTVYSLVKKGAVWVNKHDNKMSMSEELAEAIVKTVFPAESKI